MVLKCDFFCRNDLWVTRIHLLLVNGVFFDYPIWFSVLLLMLVFAIVVVQALTIAALADMTL